MDEPTHNNVANFWKPLDLQVFLDLYRCDQHTLRKTMDELIPLILDPNMEVKTWS